MNSYGASHGTIPSSWPPSTEEWLPHVVGGGLYTCSMALVAIMHALARRRCQVVRVTRYFYIYEMRVICFVLDNIVFGQPDQYLRK
jgi:hypothetical protein